MRFVMTLSTDVLYFKLYFYLRQRRRKHDLIKHVMR